MVKLRYTKRNDKVNNENSINYHIKDLMIVHSRIKLFHRTSGVTVDGGSVRLGRQMQRAAFRQKNTFFNQV